MKKTKKIKKLFTRNYNRGFTLMDVLVGVLLFSILISSVLMGYATLVKMELKAKEKIYEGVETTNKLSEKYYIFPGDE